MENYFGKSTLNTPDRDSNLDHPVTDTCESSAFDHVATKVEDIKKDIEMLAIDVDPFIPSDGSAPSSKKHGGIRRKRPAKSRSTCRPRRAKKATIFRTRNEQNKDHDGERRLSSRIQAIINTQKEHGNSSEFNVKHELEESHVISNEDEDNKPLKHSKKQARIASESSEVIEEPELIVPLPKKQLKLLIDICESKAENELEGCNSAGALIVMGDSTRPGIISRVVDLYAM
uniref:Uncharacterized protein n=1 Tax=Timema cristinae TaxID=61476 RepID=A0A7R9GS57_TIMCR|nr:unnamed protein product [Timema cristinae]